MTTVPQANTAGLSYERLGNLQLELDILCLQASSLLGV